MRLSSKIVSSKIVFKPDELKDATKDFEGQIIEAEYSDTPFGFEGRDDIERRKQLAIKIRTEAYEKEQFEWYPPNDKKLTKSAQAVGVTGHANLLVTPAIPSIINLSVLAVRNGLTSLRRCRNAVQ